MDLPQSKNELILITNVDEYVGSQFSMYFLNRGFNVRGTTKYLSNFDGYPKALAQYEDAGRFDLITIVDPSTPTTFREAVRGTKYLEGHNHH